MTTIQETNDLDSSSTCDSNPSSRPDENFSANCDAFLASFDLVAKDQFQGPKLQSLVNEFMGKHSAYITDNAVNLSSITSSNDAKLLAEDLEILKHNLVRPPEVARRLAQVYRCACQASYLTVTLNKSHFDREDDRFLAVKFGRLAIRYDSSDFQVCYWFMIAVGWYLDGSSDSRERLVYAQLFRDAILHCMQLNPENPLPHHLLGRFNLAIASMSWIERVGMKALGSARLEGTFEEAEHEFLVAHRLNPKWLPTGLWLAKTCLKLKRPAKEVKKWIEFGLSMEITEPTSVLEHKELQKLSKEYIN